MPKVRSDYQGKKGTYYIVNKAGAIHSCTRDHARLRLKHDIGYRMAEDSEIEVYLETTVQRHNRPLCDPWTPEPEILPIVPEEDFGNVAEATEAAGALASEHNIDLANVTGSGAGGRILVKDIEAIIDNG